MDDEENYELTTYSAGFYMPSDKVVRHYDVFDFEEAIEQAILSEGIELLAAGDSHIQQEDHQEPIGLLLNFYLEA